MLNLVANWKNPVQSTELCLFGINFNEIGIFFFFGWGMVGKNFGIMAEVLFLNLNGDETNKLTQHTRFIRLQLNGRLVSVSNDHPQVPLQ